MPHPDGCPTIEELHRTYNGPIPKDLRAAANAGGYARLAYLKAVAHARHWHRYLRTNRSIRKYYAEMVVERGFAPHPNQEALNQRDLEYALNGLRRARANLRAARERHLAPESMLAGVARSEIGSCDGHPMPQPGDVDA